ncbi:MAG: 4Fe-4S dicluster domain-containing protein [Planctomycetota bacterium]
MQLGFVIDHSRCIGCHACTVACKSENDVPLGSFRTWVKYTERGEFPQVKRSFAVLRCNQCTAAPCVTICPTSALEKRSDGIVDVNPDHCIGCKSCMQGCPYDALYIGMNGTAEKCHFCAHRTERGLAPACAVVCPTEAIIPGDFDDSQSVVSRMRRDLGLEARKVEAGTGPNVLYREADSAGLQPLETNASGGYLWSNRVGGVELAAEEFRAAEDASSARTTYDVEHNQWWGWRVSAYLLTKAISAGAVLAAVPTLLRPGIGDEGGAWAAGLALLFLLATTALLIADLKRPERFFLILKRPNWNSWLVRGTVFLMGYGGLLTLWVALVLARATPTGALRVLLVALMAVFAAGAAGYTGALFAQCRGRVLWMQRGLWAALIVRAVMAGAGFLVLLRPAVELIGQFDYLRWIAVVAALTHIGFSIFAGRLAPEKREKEHHEAHRLLVSGPFAKQHIAALVLPGLACLVLMNPPTPVGIWIHALAGLLLLVALWAHEDGFVKAGQALPIS